MPASADAAPPAGPAAHVGTISQRQRYCAGLIWATADGLPRGDPKILGGMKFRFAPVGPQTPSEMPSCLAIERESEDAPRRVWVSSLHPRAPEPVVMLQAAQMADGEAAAAITALALR